MGVRVVTTVRAVTTAYGREAVAALHAQIVAAKAGEPLTPVTVLVPTNSVGVATRRLLGSGALGPVTARGAGIVGVSFLTVLRLAELLAAPALAAAGRRPVSTPVVAAAVRRVLAQQPGLFAPVAAHPATEEALVAAHRELADLDAAALDTLAAQSPRARDVVRIHRAVQALLAPHWYAEHDLMHTAAELVTRGEVATDALGTLVCYLPQRMSQPAARLVRVLADRVDTTVVVGLTGDARADAAVVTTAGRLGAKVDDDALAAVTRPAGTEIVTVSDPDDEVRAVVRRLVDAMREGVPLERMAVLYAGAEPYARLLHEHLTLAEIAHNGASVRSLHDSVLGRTLLRLLALPDEGFRRDDVFAMLTSAPVLDGRGRRAPVEQWERISRRAGVVGGLDQWQVRLAQYADDLGDSDWAARERARVDRLIEFVGTLASALDPDHIPASWSGKAKWAHDLVARFLGGERARGSWPEIEQEAARRVEAVLDRLAGLDAVEEAPSLDVFRRTLDLELTSARERVGRLGEGVLVGPVALALGADLDRLFVCGLADGVFPGVARDDPLLGDAERAALNGELMLRAERVDDDHRALLAALASTDGPRVLFFPRGDLRRSTEHVPSRFLLDTVEALGGERELRPRDPWCVPVASYVEGLARAAFPATRHEHDVRAVLAGDPPAVPALVRGRELVLARRSDAFTRFDGNLAALGERIATRGPTAPEVVVSASRLETWVGCPHAYFMRYLLHVEPVERPEEVVQISPLDRGSLVHQVLDEFVARGGGIDDRALLHEIADEVCARVEARGRAGARLLWNRERLILRAELDAWLDADAARRAEHGLTTVSTEMSFGDLAIALPDGRAVRFRGAADRVDRARDGSLFVFDYKTGRPDPYRGLAPEDPVAGGTCLQLPIYAHAARTHVGAQDARVEAHYWFVGRGNNAWIGYEVDADVEAIFAETLAAIVEGIEGGVFPSRPAPPGPRFFVDCEYCDPDGLGTGDRWREWERKHDAPELAGYLALIGELDDEELG